MKTTKTHWLIGILVALAMVAAACGGNDDDGDADAPAPATEAPATEAPVAAEPEPEPEAPEPEAEEAAPAEPEPEEAPEEEEPDFQPAPTEEPEPEIPLTATWRGVTADTITIGVTYLDADLLVELGFSPNGWGDQELQIQALVDDINERGGINGRQLVALTDKYNPIGATEAEAACLRLTEDNEVFAILFGFLGPAAVANTCIVDTQETILVGGIITPDRLAQARAPWVNARTSREVSTSALFTLLEEEGMLEGRSIAVVADISAAPELENVTNLLRDRGVEPVLETSTSSQVADIIAENQEWAALSERIRASGADTLLLVGNASAGVENARLNGLEVDIWATDSSGLGANIGGHVNPESARGVITVGPMTDAQIFETDPRFKECLDVFTAKHPDIEIKHPGTLETGEDRWFTSLSFHCRFFQIFELLATAAGPNLTHETFAEAIANIGDFSVAGQPYASFGPDKLSSNDSFQLLEQDPDVGARGDLVPAGPMRDATP
jgi:ABC-type branched-subunit amino acid transport system substrate-binding protein